MATQFRDLQSSIDIPNHKYPYCLVWTALPCLTCCMPCVGHTGICKSDGTIYDFVGGGPIHCEQLAFGSPLKYLRLDNTGYTDEQWDAAIDHANQQFSQTSHNLCINNCHHHVGRVLNLLNYKGKSNWSQVDIAIMATFRASHIGYSDIQTQIQVTDCLPDSHRHITVVCGQLVIREVIVNTQLQTSTVKAGEINTVVDQPTLGYLQFM